MSHDISQNAEGQFEVFTGSNMPAWHKLGTTVTGLTTAKEALELAHLTWEVEKTPIFTNFNGAPLEIPGQFAIARKDNGRALGIVRDRYSIIQNCAAFDFFDAVVGEGQAVYDTAGALAGGKRIWLLAKLKAQLFVDSRPDDVTDRYVLLFKGHDGLTSLSVQVVALRCVCQNTISIALKGATNQLKTRHTKSYEQKIEQAQQALKLINGYYGKLQEVMNILASQKVTEKAAKAFCTRLLPEQKIGKVVVRHEAAREKIFELFRTGAGNRGESKLDLLNGTTDFIDHNRRGKSAGSEERTAERKFASTMFGTGAALKQRAMNLLLN